MSWFMDLLSAKEVDNLIMVVMMHLGIFGILGRSEAWEGIVVCILEIERRICSCIILCAHSFCQSFPKEYI